MIQMYYFLVLEVRSPKRSYGAKIKRSSGLVLSRSSIGDWVSLPASRRYLHSLVHGLFLHLQRQHCRVIASLLTLILFFSDTSYKGPCDYTGSTWIISDLKILTLITSAKYLLTIWEAIIQPTTMVMPQTYQDYYQGHKNLVWDIRVCIT